MANSVDGEISVVISKDEGVTNFLVLLAGKMGTITLSNVQNPLFGRGCLCHFIGFQP